MFSQSHLIQRGITNWELTCLISALIVVDHIFLAGLAHSMILAEKNKQRKIFRRRVRSTFWLVESVHNILRLIPEKLWWKSKSWSNNRTVNGNDIYSVFVYSHLQRNRNGWLLFGMHRLCEFHVSDDLHECASSYLRLPHLDQRNIL